MTPVGKLYLRAKCAKLTKQYSQMVKQKIFFRRELYRANLRKNKLENCIRKIDSALRACRQSGGDRIHSAASFSRSRTEESPSTSNAFHCRPSGSNAIFRNYRQPTHIVPVTTDEAEEKMSGRSLETTDMVSSIINRCSRPLNAPSPVQEFGPCGRIMKNSTTQMAVQDPANQRLTWYKPPLTVLVVKKVIDASVYSPFVQIVHWLIQDKRMVVYVEASIMGDTHLDQFSNFTTIKDKLITFRDMKDDLTGKIDFIICMGGDGTLLYASFLFQQSVPPVMAFHLGSLGFLMPFRFNDFQSQINNVLEGNAALTLRSRLRCIIIRKGELDDRKDEKPSTNVLNEVVVDRGPSPYLSNIDLFLDGKHITNVQGDGLIVSTATGSTAYAVAAGASMIHPSVPAIMVTPICPHSLSFRPIVVPAGVELKISVSPDSRNTSWVSFDGRNRQELLHGDSLQVTTSIYPVPSICAQDQTSDWFESLAECLHWNISNRRKLLNELLDLTHSSSNNTFQSLEQTELIEKDG